MFKLHFTNFGYCSNELPTLEAAQAEAKRCGFDCCILKHNGCHAPNVNQFGWTTIATWSIFEGYQELTTDYIPKSWAVEQSC